MTVIAYAYQADGKLAAFEMPEGLSNAEVIDAVKTELGAERAMLLVHDAVKNPEKEAA